jgi:hypothetical protein
MPLSHNVFYASSIIRIRAPASTCKQSQISDTRVDN